MTVRDSVNLRETTVDNDKHMSNIGTSTIHKLYTIFIIFINFFNIFFN